MAIKIIVDKNTMDSLADNCLKGECEKCLLYGVCDPEQGIDLNTFIEEE